MLNKLVLAIVVGACSTVVTNLSAATSTDMPKDEWLAKLKELVPAMICKNFTENEGVNKQLVAANINYDKCVSLIPASFDKCQTKYYGEIPSTINNESAEKWGSTVGECIGTDFALTYLVTSSTSNTSEDTSASTTKTPPATADTMTKDVWLGKLKQVVPDLICKGFLQDDSLSKQLQKLNIDYNKCVTLIPASIDKCQTELYSSIPATIDDETAGKWGHKIGECIGKDFAIKHLL